MKLKTCLFFFILISFPAFSGTAQTLQGRAAADFFTAFARMVSTGIRMTHLNDLTSFIPDEVFTSMEENLVYRVTFIGFAANQFGTISGQTNSVGFPQTLNALIGFLTIVEESGEIETWTVNEIVNRYEYLLATSWRNVNPPLFSLILQTYASYMRGELWQ